ncbi:HAMP domain-containing protein [Pelagirhabdus alkalitolerans]|uniref:histidine kinase n=1 Tax=Pelagirhabdus alkalitolerans TaxID=1612202 RepID=A0A1G6LT94_9BACI|nr:HAMP domain-containing sensor histidine kinase [Pelagirhabdus alkalitolerans]SDC46411.1 HAMP domain-containing protein [Pelagirhabdus alkalitolerans]
MRRGYSHSEVLSTQFDQETIEHVALMESTSSMITIIMDENQMILDQSNDINIELDAIISEINLYELPEQGTKINMDPFNDEYLATVTPIVSEHDDTGFIFMFESTEQLKNNIRTLTLQFTIIGVLSLFLTLTTLFILSKKLSKPLVTMKSATQMLSEKQSTSIALPVDRNDELGELANAIDHLSNHLQYLKNERNEFLSSVAHELRTPLTYIKGYADVLTKKRNLTDDNKMSYLNIIQEESERLTRLINNLFNLARSDQNKFTIYLEKTNVLEIVSDAIHFFNISFQERGIHVNLDIQSDLNIPLDRKRFYQVLIIIIDNCLKHAGAFDTLKISASDTNNSLVLTIEDNGSGIDEEHLPHVFEKLYRADKSRARSTGGSGLGLSIAKEIIHAHEGTIEMHNVDYSGTKITITLRKD